MTSEQAQAAREVAEAIGWRAERVGKWWRLIAPRSETPYCWAGLQSGPAALHEELIWKSVPSIFATTPDGAAAREEARRWLLSIPVSVLGGRYEFYRPEIKLWSMRTYMAGIDDDFGWCVELHPHRLLKPIYATADTMEEAEALAIVAAVRAMKVAGEVGE